LTCDEDTGVIEGQFQYNDHDQGIAFHGVVDDQRPNCTVLGVDLYYEGRYTPQPKNLGDPGDMRIELAGEDCLRVTLTGGAHDGYEHTGCLEGGNISVWLWSD
jgi:hypothetical protein